MIFFSFCTQTCKFPKPLVENTNPLSTAFPLHLYQESVLSPLVPFLEVSGRIQIELILFLPYMFGEIHHKAIWAWSFLYEFVFTNSIPLIGLFILSVSSGWALVVCIIRGHLNYQTVCKNSLWYFTIIL